MGVPQSPNPPHLYPQALQLKLYQAFIFSIPILFSIILFLLFYLFYLKRRASNALSPPPLPRPRRSHQTTYVASTNCQLDFKVDIKDELPIVLFDEEMRKRDSQCCVCLGDFVMKEELLQVPSCKHVFHVDCIHLWLHTNTTCPLCRCSIISNIPSKLGRDHPNRPPPPPPPSASEPPPFQTSSVSSQNHASLELQRQDGHASSRTSNIFTSFTREQVMSTTTIEESSNGNSATTSTNLINSGRLSSSQLPNRESENVVHFPGPGSVVIHIQTHGT